MRAVAGRRLDHDLATLGLERGHKRAQLGHIEIALERCLFKTQAEAGTVIFDRWGGPCEYRS
jgi:hypothetical protein